MTLSDTSEWLADLVRAQWAATVDDLLAAGHDIAVKEPPIVSTASNKKAAGQTRNFMRLKIYEGSDLANSPRSWGDVDRDVSLTMVVQLEMGGTNAPLAARDSRRIIDRILQRYRKHPHPEWDRFASWRSTKLEDFPDYQRIAFNIILSKHGEIHPTPVVEL